MPDRTPDDTQPPLPPFLLRALLATLLLAIGFYVGAPAAHVSWTQGDEYRFIVNNVDVTGDESGIPLTVRIVQIFGKVHGDLYQPIPIASYAIEWALWGEKSAFAIRFSDLLLHLLNGLLVWCVLARILRWQCDDGPARLIGWTLALLWTVHPALVRAYAADMGRTHVLSATFALLALAWLIAWIEHARMRDAVLSLVALLLAMLSKPVVGWFLVAGLLVWRRRDLRAALTAWPVWAAAVLCGVFAVVTMRTSESAGLLEYVGEGLFGSPVTRSLLASWLYVRDSLVPLDLPIWYIPDIATGWSHPPVLLGLGVVLVSGVLMVVTLRRPGTRLIAVGLAWYWIYLLPVLGLVGARFSAAGDRYLYQPLIGLLLALGLAMSLLPKTPGRVAAGAVLLASLALVPGAREFATTARSMIARADDVVRRNPEDPRAFENHGAVYSFLVDHPEAGRADGSAAEYAAVAVSSLERAAELAGAARYFNAARTRAGFYQRISENLQKLGASGSALDAARTAWRLYPDDAVICTRYAHAARVAEAWSEALQAYDSLATCPPEDPGIRTMRMTEHGDLLLYVFEQPQAAMAIYRAAQEVGAVPDRAKVGLARCEVLIGEGAVGFELAREIPEDSPSIQLAQLVIAMYHLRSGHVAEAGRAYSLVLARDPTSYEALRGFHEVAALNGRWDDAATGWQLALEREPGNEVFRSYYAWALALADRPESLRVASRGLRARAGDPFSCFAVMLHELRAGRIEQAVLWAQEGAAGPAHPKAREVQRAELSLRLLQERGAVGADALLVRASLWRGMGNADEASRLLREAGEAGLSEAGSRLLTRMRAGVLEGMPVIPGDGAGSAGG